MDLLQLSVADDDGYPIYPDLERVVRIRVNGRDLLEAIQEAELPKGHPEVAGRYVGPPLVEVAPPSRYFYGYDGIHNNDLVGRPRAVSLCVCAGCGDSGCADWGIWIDDTDETVTWSHMGNWRPGMASTLDAVGPFTFARGAYDREVGLLGEALEPMFMDRLELVRRVGIEPQLIVAQGYGSRVARQPWGLILRYEQNNAGSGPIKMGHGIWAAATEEEIRRREQMAAEFLGL